MMRARLPQFRFTAVAVEHTDSSHSVVPRTYHIKTAVADHDGLRRVDIPRLQGMAQQVGLVGMQAIQFGAEHAAA